MPQVFGLALFLLVALVPDAIGAGVTYQWTDADGVVHFADDPGKIPENFRDTAKEIHHPDEPKSPPLPHPESESPPETKPRVSPSEPLDALGHNREWWQGRVQIWQTRKADAQAKLADAQDRLGRERFLKSTPDTSQRIQEISDEITEYEEQIREAEKMLTVDLPEEARKAHAPPGWLRE
jgi:hypothetical protein